MRIKELSQLSGMAASAIRFYEDEGLLPPVRRSDNGYRSYGNDHVERLRFIQRCRSLDMSLEDIRRMTGLLFQNLEADPDEEPGENEFRILKQLSVGTDSRKGNPTGKKAEKLK